MPCIIFLRLYFNSQPHEEADGLRTRARGRHDISTHSLTKRLTWKMRRMISMLMYFNSQPHEEADDNTVQGWMLHPISTHSLTKRLTPWNHEHGTLLQNFNSQPHEEADGNFAQKFLVQNCIFVTITYIVFSVHLLFDFLCIFSS